MDKDLEAALKELPEMGYIEETANMPNKVLKINRSYLNTSHAHIAVSDTSEDIYWHRKFKERNPLTARRFLAFVLGRFSDKEKKEYLGYAKYLGKTDGSCVEELSLIPIESIKDYFGLAQAMKIISV